jgi:hypothetical protein
MRDMSPKRFCDTMRLSPKAIAVVAPILLLQALPSAQAGEIVTRDCLHGSAETRSSRDSTQYGEQYGSGYGDRHGTSYSYTRPADIWAFSRFRHRRGLVTNTVDPNGGGSITGADSGTSGGYGAGASNGYTTGSLNSTGDDSCVEIRRDLVNPYIIHVAPPATDKDAADIAARERLWQARCRPVIRQDVYGVRRYQYAAAGCDYGKYE